MTSSYAISAYKQALKVYIPPLLMCFEYSKLHDIMAKNTIRNLKVFRTNT